DPLPRRALLGGRVPPGLERPRRALRPVRPPLQAPRDPAAEPGRAARLPGRRHLRSLRGADGGRRLRARRAGRLPARPRGALPPVRRLLPGPRRAERTRAPARRRLTMGYRPVAP